MMMVDTDGAKAFRNDFSNLDTITRLCLACGPIPDMDMAKNTLDMHSSGFKV